MINFNSLEDICENLKKQFQTSIKNLEPISQKEKEEVAEQICEIANNIINYGMVGFFGEIQINLNPELRSIFDKIIFNEPIETIYSSIYEVISKYTLSQNFHKTLISCIGLLSIYFNETPYKTYHRILSY